MNRYARCAAAVSLVVSLVSVAGCYPPGALPDSFEVNTSATEKHAAARDTGPAALRDSVWVMYRKPEPGEPSQPPEPAQGPYGGLLNGGLLARPAADEPIFRLHFGANGAMTLASENRYFLADIYGVDVPIDGIRRPTTLPGVTFRSASYGLQVGERFGIAVVVQVELGAIPVGRAVLYAWGALSGGEGGGGPERIDGTFGYLLDFDDGVGSLLLSTGGDQYPMYAVRAVE